MHRGKFIEFSDQNYLALLENNDKRLHGYLKTTNK